MKPAGFSYQRPLSLAEAIGGLNAVAAQPRVIAGGQSLGPMLNLRLSQPKTIIDISRLADLRSSAMEGEVLAIGACVTHAEIEDGAIPDVTLGLMQYVAGQIAYRAVRNRGTIGGSLAHADPAADWLTTMIALDATLRLAGPAGKRCIKVADFIRGALDTALGEDEIVTHVLVSRLSPDARWGHAKYAKKLGDFAESLAIAVVDPKRKMARMILGRRAEPPVPMHAISTLLASEDQPRGETLRAAIESDLKRIDADMADWTLHGAILRRAVEDLSA